jgi:hypothetical protein
MTVIGGGASIAEKSGAGSLADSYPNGKTGWAADFLEFNVASTGTVTAIWAPAEATAP